MKLLIANAEIYTHTPFLTDTISEPKSLNLLKSLSLSGGENKTFLQEKNAHNSLSSYLNCACQCTELESIYIHYIVCGLSLSTCIYTLCVCVYVFVFVCARASQSSLSLSPSYMCVSMTNVSRRCVSLF